MSALLGWLARLVFGKAAAPIVEEVEEVALSARDFMVTLQDDTRPMPLSSSAVARRNAQIAQGAHAFPVAAPAGPPTCPPSLPPSAPPKARLSSVPPAPPSSVPSHRVPPPVARSQSRPSSGPPPRLPPVHLVPPPPVFPRPPRPSRRR